ncbi:MAG: heme o synthase [Candidatus Zixiibacteriota bacterium]
MNESTIGRGKIRDISLTAPISNVRIAEVAGTGFASQRLAGFSQSVRTLGYLILLTKPAIMFMVLFTGAAALIVEGNLVNQPLKFLLFLLGLYMTGGAANAFNQYFERDIDKRMLRTSSRRPLPMGKISPWSAVLFSIILGTSGVALLAVTFNILTAGLSLATILFYSLFYTLWLKPNTSQNIVIGGIAGAMAPIGAWAAATGETSLVCWLMFLIIFFWTPPHFWALALKFRDDYDKVKLPMLPNVKGEVSALTQISIHASLLFMTSGLLFVFWGGWLFGVSAVGLGVIFAIKIIKAWRYKSSEAYWGIFKFSLIYLFGLFMAIIGDAVLKRFLI